LLLDDLLGKLKNQLDARLKLPLPQFWWSTEWFCPDGFYGIGIPFYLGHPRLIELEKTQVGYAEGCLPEEGIKILRHELGHAIDNGFHLRRNRLRQQIFGKSSKPYPTRYIQKPYSRQFVRHLPRGYAQSHPTEDFAETFAVWLEGKKIWRQRYQGWGALKKLEAMDFMMVGIRGQKPKPTSLDQPYSLSDQKRTLSHHYHTLQSRRDPLMKEPFDRWLKELTESNGLQTEKALRKQQQRFQTQLITELSNNVSAPLYRLETFVDALQKHLMKQGTTLSLEQKEFSSKSLPVILKAAKLYLEKQHDAIYL
jgi:hypothetical protein